MKCRQELQNDFFEKFRVFTVIGHGQQLSIRIHRAVKLDPEDPHVAPDYPLEYQYETAKEVGGTDYTQAQVQSLIRRILDWASNVLLSTL